MVRRGLIVRFGVVGSVLTTLVAGCAGEPRNDVDPPDTDLISVFYPVDGVVRGLGLPGAVPSNVDRIYVRAHPTSTLSCSPVNEDGSFEFRVVAVDNDILEMTGAFGSQCDERGAPSFVRVPISPLPPVDFVCCHGGGSNGTCQSITAFENGDACPDEQTGVPTCTFDQDCGSLEGEKLLINEGQITVSPPNESGTVTIEGVVEYENALVRVQNLKLSPLGYETRLTRRATIANDKGQFRFENFVAAGDDELAVQIQDLNGFRSPAIGKTVPDAPLGGLDIIGVYAYEDLEGDQEGPIAIHVAPYGIDGRGMCPDSGVPDDWICYTGGVTHEMLNIVDVQVVSTNVSPNLTPTPTSSSSPNFEFNTGVIGDVRSGAQDIVIVLDLSEEAAPTFTERQIQIEEVKQFIDRLRSRDRVAAVVMTGYEEGAMVGGGLVRFDARANLKAGLDAYVQTDQAAGSVSGSLEGLVLASKILRDAGSLNGKVVMLVAQPPNQEDEIGDDKPTLFQTRVAAAFEGVLGPVGSTVPVYETHILGLDLVPETGNFTVLNDIVDFTQGRYWSTTTTDPGDLEQTLTDLLQELSGAFVLLYNMDVPCVGKSMTLDITLELALGEQRATSTYRGPVRIQRGCQQ